MAAISARSRMTRILIVDDHPLVRSGLRRLLTDEPDMEVCGEAANASEAIEQIRTLNPDLALIDISLNGCNGIELMKQVKAMGRDVAMLVVSMHDDELYAERALRAGAKGYVNKHEMATTIVEAIRRVMSGQVYLSHNVADRLLLRMVHGHDDATTSPVDSLSDRELEVFEMIGEGMTTGEIARRLHLSTKTIETHRENIKTKLRLRNANELIRHAVHWTLEQQGGAVTSARAT